MGDNEHEVSIRVSLCSRSSDASSCKPEIGEREELQRSIRHSSSPHGHRERRQRLSRSCRCHIPRGKSNRQESTKGARRYVARQRLRQRGARIDRESKAKPRQSKGTRGQQKEGFACRTKQEDQLRRLRCKPAHRGQVWLVLRSASVEGCQSCNQDCSKQLQQRKGRHQGQRNGRGGCEENRYENGARVSLQGKAGDREHTEEDERIRQGSKHESVDKGCTLAVCARWETGIQLLCVGDPNRENGAALQRGEKVVHNRDGMGCSVWCGVWWLHGVWPKIQGVQVEGPGILQRRCGFLCQGLHRRRAASCRLWY